MTARPKYVARAEDGIWRIWNRKTNRPWGNPYKDYPGDLLVELNGPKRPEKLTVFDKELQKVVQTKKVPNHA